MDLSLVSKFLSTNEVGKIVDGFANPSPDMLQKAEALYVAHQGRLPSPAPPEQLQPSETLRVFVVEFSDGMRNFLEKARDEEAKDAFNCKSWEELTSEATKAMQALDTHNKRRRNWRNPFEAADKVGGAVARRIEFLIELIPDGDYTRILAGGLKLLYNTAKRKKDIRESILDTLDSLCDTISHTKSEIKLYSRDAELKKHSEDLYMAILDFVRHAVVYLDKSSASESFKAFFQQKRYGSKLEEAIENIKKTSSSFENCVSVCFQRRVQNIDRNVESLRHPIVAIFFLLAGIVKDFPSQLERLKSDMHNATMAHMHTLLFAQLPNTQPAISTQQLHQLLSTDWKDGRSSVTEDLFPTVKADVQTALRFVPSQLNEEQIGLLMSDNGFMSWLKSLASQFIIIHDKNALESNSSLSPLSYLCSLISEMLSVPGMFRLNFFCGLHSAVGSTLQGGNGIMRSLALQLLPAFGNMSFPVDPNLMVPGLMMNDFATLCSVFAMFLQNIPAGVIYIMIDGAFWYNTEARTEEMKAVMLFLNQLVLDLQVANRGLVLKVLVTNPTPRQRSIWGLQVPVIHLEQRLLTSGHGSDARRLLTNF